MVVDTSAAMAILLGEPEADAMGMAIERAARTLMSAATLVEVGIVVEARFGAAGRGIVDRFLRDAEIDVVPLDRVGVDLAVDGWRRFGRGRHAAALNLGDCFTWAAATAANAPVLCTGHDFARTDLPIVGHDDST